MKTTNDTIGASRLRKAIGWCIGHPFRTFALFFAFYATFVVASAVPRIALESHLVTGDGFYYFCYARSLLIDRDVNFKNEYEEFGPVCMGKTLFPFSGDQTGRPAGVADGALLPDEPAASSAPEPYGPWSGPFPDYPGNMWAIGSAVLWLPFMAIAHLLVLALNASGLASIAPDGYGVIYQCAVGLAANFYAYLGALLLYRTLRNRFGPAESFFTVLSLITASALVCYVVYQVAYGHAQEFFACSLAFFVFMRRPSFSRMSYSDAFICGAAVGLAAMTRWQTAVWALVPLGLWLRDLFSKNAKAPLFLKGSLCVLGACVAFLPQSLAWKSIYGTYLTSPVNVDWGSTFFRFRLKEMLFVLFSNNHGLFFWHPVTFAGFIGLFGYLVGRPFATDRCRLTVGLGLVVFLITAFVNGTVSDWWGGSAFGMRRMIGTYPVLAWGLAVLLSRLKLADGKPVLTASLWLVLSACNAALLGVWIFHLGGRLFPH